MIIPQMFYHIKKGKKKLQFGSYALCYEFHWRFYFQ